MKKILDLHAGKVALFAGGDALNHQERVDVQYNCLGK